MSTIGRIPLRGTVALTRRGEHRLAHDLAQLEERTAASNRVTVQCQGFRAGDVNSLALVFHGVRTLYRDRSDNEVRVLARDVLALVNPRAADVPYPFARPEVRLFFPALPRQLRPWIGNVLIIDDAPRAPAEIPALAHAGLGLGAFGVPCLMRGWSHDNDLLFLAAQLHQVLTDPRDTSPRDALNPEAARWLLDEIERRARAGEPPLLPTEPPIGELHPVAPRVTKPTGFTLTEVVAL